MEKYTVVTFYKFVQLPDFAERQQPLLDFCNAHEIRGTILLAEEGINATIVGSHKDLVAVLNHLRADPCFSDLTYKESTADHMIFDRMKVRLKKEIVTMKWPNADPQRVVGTYVDAREWNTLISQPDVITIDVRNDYEVEIGTFEGAINPKTDSFSEFPDFVERHLNPHGNKKVAMFCTGGIRCEKATSYLLQQGFEQVYHLNGGILKYLETVPETETKWRGECFVFDQRVSVDHHLQPGKANFCEQCKALLPDAEMDCPNCDG